MKRLGIVVNPMSGRDVRRVAARASTSSHHEKQQQVTRLVLGAFSQGVEEIFLANEPYRINSRAVENLQQRDRVRILDIPLTHTAADTKTMVQRMWQEGCRVFIVLGGDGTNRTVASSFPDAVILPLSTGTNNVFSTFVEASIAGAAAGLIASGQMQYRDHCRRCKQIHISLADVSETALIDAVLLKNDILGSLLPFEANNIVSALLTRANPASIGVSPIGGYLLPCQHDDEFAVFLQCGEIGRSITIPISSGLYDDVHVSQIEKVALGNPITIDGPGILAFDGDRTIKLGNRETARLEVRRDGPWVIETTEVMNSAARSGLFETS
ncbi:MAG: NAD(+)/NADH kinase [Gammaproteobacteria bacterium]|nr:NAD(+)/NADH kinase [Gammaproteobacteria bacterium]